MAPKNKSWDSEKHPASTSALVNSLQTLKKINPKAARSNVHIYPASIYAAGESAGESSKAPSQENSALRDRRITSWKMTEHMYRKHDNPFPTLARGLFTEELEQGDEVPSEALKVEGEWQEGQARERIVARGYDKFFNIDEVEWTEWAHMKAHTGPPYYLTLKSNGCLILVSALTPSHLLVASKHSLGTTTEADAAKESKTATDSLANGIQALDISKDDKGKGKMVESEDKDDAEGPAHAEVGRAWVKKMLTAAGKTEAELAARLWKDNLTAVLELCDDSFEEHVLATPAHWTGLHLHGLNHNAPHFSTVSPPEVTAFAEEFGFIPTKYLQMNTIDEVKEFTSRVEKEGTWEGDQIEGFVVRGTVAAESSRDRPGKPPYQPGSPFFFKVKFEEPYLLYRQWREMTRTMLPLREVYSSTKVDHPGKLKGMRSGDDPAEAIWRKVRKHVQRQEVAVYADWCGRMLRDEPGLFDDFNRGVVRVREKFMQWTEEAGREAWTQAKEGKYRLQGGKKPQSAAEHARLAKGKSSVTGEAKPKKWLIVPIAVPGCGKTLIGVALTKLFGFGHTQSDDVTAKRTAPTFLKNILTLFKTNDVVYADRNNHIDKHYDELSNLAKDKSLAAFDLHLVGIVWDVVHPPYHRLLRICSERVVKRGDNHRTLRPNQTAEADHEDIVGQFLRNWTPPDEDSFASLIWVNVDDDPRTCLVKVIDGLAKIMNIKVPEDAAVDDALDEGSHYQISGPYKPPQMKMGRPPRYYAIAPEIDLTVLMSSILDHDPSEHGVEIPRYAHELFDALRASNRITPNPHITLCHEDEVKEEKAQNTEKDLITGPGPHEQLWERCKALAAKTQLYSFKITHLVWDDRVMALATTPLVPRPRGENSEKASNGEVDDASRLDELEMYKKLETLLHITVGTKREEVRPHEAIEVVLAMRRSIEKAGDDAVEAREVVPGGGKVRWVTLNGIEGEGRIKGMS